MTGRPNTSSEGACYLIVWSAFRLCQRSTSARGARRRPGGAGSGVYRERCASEWAELNHQPQMGRGERGREQSYGDPDHQAQSLVRYVRALFCSGRDVWMYCTDFTHRGRADAQTLNRSEFPCVVTHTAAATVKADDGDGGGDDDDGRGEAGESPSTIMCMVYVERSKQNTTR